MKENFSLVDFFSETILLKLNQIYLVRIGNRIRCSNPVQKNIQSSAVAVKVSVSCSHYSVLASRELKDIIIRTKVLCPGRAKTKSSGQSDSTPEKTNEAHFSAS